MRQVKNSFWIFLIAILLLNSCKKEGALSPDTAKINLDALIFDLVLFGTYEKGVPLTAENYLIIDLFVKTPGRYNISTPVVNGYKFSGSGEFKISDQYTIKLKGEGTPLSEKKDCFKMASLSDLDSVNVQVVSNLSSKIIVTTLTDNYRDSTCAITGRGNVLWQKSGIYAFNIVINGIVYSSYNNGLYAFDILTGQEVWSKSTFGSIKSMTVANNSLIIVNGSSDIQAVRPSDGTIIWTFDNPSTIASGVAVQNGKLYFGSDGLNALSSDGLLLWHNVLGTSSPKPVPGGDKIYVLTPGYLQAFDINTGALLWKKVISNEQGAPVYSGGKVFVNGYNKTYCFDATTGNSLWQYDLVDVNDSPVIYGNNLLLTCDFGLTLIEAVNISTGLKTWSSKMYSSSTNLIASDEIAYIGVLSDVYGVYLKTGEVIFVLTRTVNFRPENISVVYDKLTKTAVYPLQ